MLSVRIVAALILASLVGLIAYARLAEIEASKEAAREAALVYTTKDEGVWLAGYQFQIKSQWRRTLSPDLFRFDHIERHESVIVPLDIWYFEFQYSYPSSLSFYGYTYEGEGSVLI